MLIAIGGLPGVGKTTTARELARRLGAAHVRIDALESAAVTTGLAPSADSNGPAGYDLALAVADTCLAAGTGVVVDAVFPLAISRRPWSDLAARHGVGIRWFRLICSDAEEHRRRVGSRAFDLPGAARPDWAAVLGRETDEWIEPHTVVDTAADDPVDEIERLLEVPTGVVRRHVEAFDACDVERVLDGLTEDVRWETAAGRAEGIGEMRELLLEVFALSPPRLDLEHLATGPDGVVAAEITTTTSVDGLPISGLVCAWYRVRDGRIAEARIYRDSGEAT